MRGRAIIDDVVKDGPSRGRLAQPIAHGRIVDRTAPASHPAAFDLTAATRLAGSAVTSVCSRCRLSSVPAPVMPQGRCAMSANRWRRSRDTVAVARMWCRVESDRSLPRSPTATPRHATRLWFEKNGSNQPVKTLPMTAMPRSVPERALHPARQFRVIAMPPVRWSPRLLANGQSRGGSCSLRGRLLLQSSLLAEKLNLPRQSRSRRERVGVRVRRRGAFYNEEFLFLRGTADRPPSMDRDAARIDGDAAPRDAEATRNRLQPRRDDTSPARPRRPMSA